MKKSHSCRTPLLAVKLTLSLSFLFVAGLSVCAQSPPEAEPNAEATQTRLMRARVLAVIGSFSAAAGELEALRAQSNDESVRDVARILLMGVYLRLSNYTRVRGLLEEALKARMEGKENTTHVYFALSGQLLNGVRSRLNRYREFGLNIADEHLSVEARSDLDHIRSLIEHVVEQAKAIREGNDKNTDSIALLEEAAGVRLTLARNNQERMQWQREIAEARQRLAASGTRLAVSRSGNSNNATRDRLPANFFSAPTAAFALKTKSADTASTTDKAGTTNTAPATAGTPTSDKDVAVAATKPKNVDAASTAPPAPPKSSQPNGVVANSSSKTSKSPMSIGSLHDKATLKMSPTYPQTARSARVAGTVTVFLVIDEKGAVESVQSTSGPIMLQQAAADAARRWKFRPTQIDGRPVRVAGFISFNFTL